MARNTMNVVKGVGIGLLAGAAVAVIGPKMMKTNKRQMKRNANQALHAASDFIDGIEYIFKN